MEAKYYGLLGITVVLVLMVTLLTHNTNPEAPEPLIALSPYIVFEGTVVPLSLDESRDKGWNSNY